MFEEWVGGDLSISSAVDFPQAEIPSRVVTIRPHPVIERSTVAISGDRSEASPLAFSLYDVRGRLIHTHEIHDPRGFTFERAGMQAGVYFYRLVASGTPMASGRLVIE